MYPLCLLLLLSQMSACLSAAMPAQAVSIIVMTHGSLVTI